MPEPHRRSYSQIEQLRRCGWAFKLKRVDKLPENPSWAAVCGSAVHFASEKIDSEWASADADALARQGIADANAYVANEVSLQDVPSDKWTAFGWKPKQDGKWWAEKGIPNAIHSYVQWRLDHPNFQVLPEFIERSFDINLGDVWVIGKIDRVFVDTDNGTPFAVDLKTGNKPKTDEQLGMYRVALAADGLDVTYGMYVYGLKRGTAETTNPIDLRHWTAQKLYTVYKQVDIAATAGLFIPNPGEQCRICPFRDSCDFSQSAL